MTTRGALPLILIRGFGGLGVEDEKRIAYQGFNDGTVYPHKRGENYIYEGLILRFLKSYWQYQDATNVVGYYGSPVAARIDDIPAELKPLEEQGFFQGEDKVIIDVAMAKHLVDSSPDVRKTLWVFRYYDLDDRNFPVYGSALVRLIDLIRALAAIKPQPQPPPPVNIIAHSMGGLIVREAIQSTFPGLGRHAEDFVNKVVTLGAPHKGITFQVLRDLWLKLDAEKEIERFSPEFQDDQGEETSYKNLHKHFPLDRFLTVVGTNYKTYGSGLSSLANRLFSIGGEYGPNYNRSDGLVKQDSAQIPDAPRTFVHKCHGGLDSLVTSREAFEIATRFFFGNVRARLHLVDAKITRGKDFFGKSEFFFGVRIKPRKVDFELFHQSADAENCYGPFKRDDLGDESPTFDWADNDRMIWEGYLDTQPILQDPSLTVKDMVLRVDVYVGERDLLGIGFSDNVIFRKQYYVRALLEPQLEFQLHTDESFQKSPEERGVVMKPADRGWEFEVEGTGFRGRFRIELDRVPEEGEAAPLAPATRSAGSDSERDQ